MVDINIGHQHWTSYLKDMLDINAATGTLGSRSPEQVACLEATRTMGTTLSVTAVPAVQVEQAAEGMGPTLVCFDSNICRLLLDPRSYFDCGSVENGEVPCLSVKKACPVEHASHPFIANLFDEHKLIV